MMEEDHNAKISTSAKAHTLVKEASRQHGLKMWKVAEDAITSYVKAEYPEVYRECMGA